MTLESDKATMDVPSPAGGVVGEVLAKIGDKVSHGLADPDAGGQRGAGRQKPQAEPAPSEAPRAEARDVRRGDATLKSRTSATSRTFRSSKSW